MIAELRESAPAVLDTGMSLAVMRVNAEGSRWRLDVRLPKGGICSLPLPKAKAMQRSVEQAGSVESAANAWFQSVAEVLGGLAADFQAAADECRVRGGRFPEDTPCPT